MENDLYKLQGSVSLLKQAWNIFTKKYIVFWGIISIPVIFVLLLSFLAVILTILGINISSLISPISVIILLTLVAAIFFWSQASLYYTIVNDSNIKESYIKSKDLLWDYLFLSFFSGIIIFCGFALFIIPGIIFSVLFSLAMFFLIADGNRGADALLSSYNNVRNYWWPMFARIIFIALVFFVALWIASLLLQVFGLSKDNIQSITNVLMFFVQPISAVYYFLIYKDLKKANKGMERNTKRSLFVNLGIGSLFISTLIIIYLLLNPIAMNILYNLLLQ